MKRSRIRAKLERNEPALITTLHFMDASLYELTSLMGFDGIWMDMEHHSYSLETAAQMMRAARVGASDIVARPAKGEWMRMARMLEAGAQAIMYPQCDSEQEAAEVVRWAKFPPQGRRGLDAANADAPYLFSPPDRYTLEANQQTLIVIQIENLQALQRVDQIAATDGVDVLMLGPGDLSLQMGIAGQLDHPRIQEAAQRIADAAGKAGKHWGCPVASPEHAVEVLELDARFICYHADIVMIKAGMERMQSEFVPLGFTFDNRLNECAIEGPSDLK